MGKIPSSPLRNAISVALVLLIFISTPLQALAANMRKSEANIMVNDRSTDSSSIILSEELTRSAVTTATQDEANTVISNEINTELQTELQRGIQNDAEIDLSEEMKRVQGEQNYEYITSGETDGEEDYYPGLNPIENQMTVNADEQTGAASYSFPITLPPGRSGLQPNLALSYNSQNADKESILGLGWNTPIAYIERIPRKGIDQLYDENYFYSSLSGEILPITLTDETHGTYGAKVETGNFLNYEFTSDNKWIVTTKTGTKYTFGKTSASRQDDPTDQNRIYRWMIEGVRDTNDNFIKYEYTKSDGQIYLTRVSYTGSGNSEGIFEVVFSYEDRADYSTQFDVGFSTQTTSRIKTIETRVNGQWVRKYELTYSSGDNGLSSMLKSIKETGRSDDGTITTLPPTEFNYAKSSAVWELDPDLKLPIPLWMNDFNHDMNVRLVDLNGDGFTDIIKASEKEKAVFINNGDNSGWTEDPNYQIPVIFYNTFNSGSYDNGIEITDVNGDGLPDLIHSKFLSQNNPGNINEVYLNKGDGTGWELDPNRQLPEYFKADGTDMDEGRYIIDVNGDGLVDFINSAYSNASNQYNDVYINNGSSWVKDSNYTLPLYLWNNSDSDRGVTFMEVNGDGLIDIVKSWEAGGVISKAVYINKGDGTGWKQDNDYTVPELFYSPYDNGLHKGVREVDINGDGLQDIIKSSYLSPQNVQNDTYLNNGDGTGWEVDEKFQLPVYLYMSGTDMDRGHRLVDVNGDGLLDFVRASYSNSNNNYNEVYINKSNKPNLLTNIKTSEGATTTISYNSSTAYKKGSDPANPKLPMVMEVVDTITTNDGFGNIISTSFLYEGGEYYFNNPFDRKFAGFSKVTKTDSAGNKTEKNFHQGNDTAVQLGEFLDDAAKINMVYKTELFNNSGNLFTRTINKWDKYALGEERNFVYIKDTLTQNFDGSSSHKDKAESFTYNTNNGNLTFHTSWGEVNGNSDGSFSDIGGDKVTQEYTYASQLAGLPTNIIKKNNSGTKINEVKKYYDNQALGQAIKGNLTKEEHWVENNQYINTQNFYNQSGLVTKTIDPNGNSNEYIYDSKNLYPIKVTNPLGQTTEFKYDYSSGQTIQVVDANKNTFSFNYDGLDRIVEEFQPESINPNNLVLKTTYIYSDSTVPRFIKTTEYLDANNGLDKFTYIDGLNRKIQERMESQDGFNVIDYKYNSIGLLQASSLPYLSSGSQKTAATTNSNLYTTFTYDALQRTTSVTTAAGTLKNQFDQWQLTTTDQNQNTRKFTYNAYGQLTQVDEHNNSDIYSTNYQYDGNENLIQIIDAQGNLQRFKFNAAGALTAKEDLHAPSDNTYGTWTFKYDNARNLIYQKDPNNKVVTYKYDALNRLSEENFIGSKIIYEYDNCTNGVGKLCSSSTVKINAPTKYYSGIPTLQTITSSALTSTALQRPLSIERVPNPNIPQKPISLAQPKGGLMSIKTESKTSYTYDSLGNVVAEIKEIEGTKYVSKATFNRQGQNTTYTYPDDKKVNFTFDNGGQIKTVKLGTKAIVKNVDYSPMGQIKTIEYANGVTSRNTFNPNNLYRLEKKLTENSAKEKLQEISYTYDAIGNVTDILDQSQNQAAKQAHYQYDDLYRLTKAEITNSANSENYVRTFNYDSLGNITNKSDIGAYLYEGDQGNNYANPHAVTQVGETTYQYDKNGNLTSNSDGLSLDWDYQNHLIHSSNNGTEASYVYDSNGQRLIKSTGSGTTVYPTQSFELDNDRSNKHISIGNVQVANVENDGTRDKVYFSHSDHLSSSNITTGEKGELIQTLDYYPYGEVRLNEQNTEFDERNKYTGHELDSDSETDLYYANARYYDPKIGRFMSVDPWSGDTTNPQTLNDYAYVMNNPMKYTDPTGEVAFLIPAAQTGVALLAVVVEAAAVATYGYASNEIKNHYDLTPPAPEVKLKTYTIPPESFEGERVPEGYRKTVEPGINISTTPEYADEAPTWLVFPDKKPETLQGACGGNMSCIKINLPEDPEAAGYEWRGTGEKGVKDGNWYNPKTGERINPDQKHEQPIGPHDDYMDPDGNMWRVFPDGSATPK